MPKLPQVNVRLAPEHHELIRRLAQRLRDDPGLAVGLAEFLAHVSPGDRPQVSPLPRGLADEVAALKERVAALERRTAGPAERHAAVRTVPESGEYRVTRGRGHGPDSDRARVVFHHLDEEPAKRFYDRHHAKPGEVVALWRPDGSLVEFHSGPPKQQAPGTRRPPTAVTDDLRRRVHDMRGDGLKRDAIVKALGIGAGTVSKILGEPRPAG